MKPASLPRDRAPAIRVFEKVILQLVKSGPERVAIEAGQIDAIIDPATGNTLLLPEAQQALIERQASFRNLVGLSSDWYWHQDEQHRFVAYASTAARNSGIWDEDIIGKALWDLADEGTSTADWRMHRQQLEWRATFRDFEVSRKDAAGEVHCLSLSGEPVFNDQHEFKGYQGITRDVTERRQAEAANRFARVALDALAASVAVLDAAGVVLMANRAWRAGGNAAEDANYLDALGEQKNGKSIAADIRKVIDGALEQFCCERAGFTLNAFCIADGSAARAVVSKALFSATRNL